MHPMILTLTPRQRQAVELAAQGLSYREIGDALGISDQTVKNHLRDARDRNGMSTIALCVAWARESGAGCAALAVCNLGAGHDGHHLFGS